MRQPLITSKHMIRQNEFPDFLITCAYQDMPPSPHGLCEGTYPPAGPTGAQNVLRRSLAPLVLACFQCPLCHQQHWFTPTQKGQVSSHGGHIAADIHKPASTSPAPQALNHRSREACPCRIHDNYIHSCARLWHFHMYSTQGPGFCQRMLGRACLGGGWCVDMMRCGGLLLAP